MQSYLGKYCHEHPEDTPNGRKRCREAQRFLSMMLDCSVHGVILRHKKPDKLPPEPFQNDLAQFEVFAMEKGLTESSYRRIYLVIRGLSFFLLQKGILDFSIVTDEDMLAFAKTLMGYSKKSLSVSMYALRVFIFYLNCSGRNPSLTKENIPSVRYVCRRHLPKVWSEDECRRILAAVDRNAPIGKRDYAVLMLAINLGMRTSDILALEFGNIDWEKGQIHFVQKKTGANNTLQLDKDTGWAIIDYLKNGRPDVKQYSTVFLRHKVPFCPMAAFDIVLQKYLERADVHYAPEQMHGMHSLRHSLATRMLRQEIPVSTIADILGHVNMNSSVDYLQIDIEGMRRCALEVEL